MNVTKDNASNGGANNLRPVKYGRCEPNGYEIINHGIFLCVFLGLVCSGEYLRRRIAVMVCLHLFIYWYVNDNLCYICNHWFVEFLLFTWWVNYVCFRKCDIFNEKLENQTCYKRQVIESNMIGINVEKVPTPVCLPQLANFWHHWPTLEPI